MKSCQFCHNRSSIEEVPLFWMTEQRGHRAVEQLGDSGRLFCDCSVTVLSPVPVLLSICEECLVNASYQLSGVAVKKM